MPQKQVVLDLLYETFRDSPASVGVVKQDSKIEKRFKLLLEYSYFLSKKQGNIYLSEDNTACCLTIDSKKKKISIAQFYWYFILAFRVIGLKKAPEVLRRMKTLNNSRPKEPHIYIWYIGVTKEQQGKGVGTALLKKIIALNKNSPICLETTKPSNFPFYEKLGFHKQKTIEGLNYSFTPYLLKNHK